MALTPGTVLVHYRLAEKIGTGGMGEVWRAVNTTLGREVAIKTLPAAFAAEPERLARFEREAKLLASLNHPNIATIHGLHEADGVRFLAMELVPGEDLSARLAKGPIPVAEAVDVARQVAEALETAHEQGVIHRDLKPANIQLTPGGRVKVLDFGLAKAAEAAPAAAPGDPRLSPTITSLGTVAGVILGTAAYMSPEQARGKPVDKRADVWALGCVLFEMLGGKRPFEGETISDTLAAVLAKDPDWKALPAAVPARLRALIGRCLEKDAKRRLRDIGEARIELEDALASRTSSGTIPVAAAPAAAYLASARRGSPLALAMTVVALVAAAAALWAWMRPAPAVAPARLMRLRVERPPGEANTGPGSFAISPDGSAVVFVVQGGSEITRLWLRELSDTTGHDLPGTENAAFPFWSADSRHIAFFADAKLKRIPRAGGAVQSVCEATTGRGGAWNRSGVIVFAPSPYGVLMKVEADGGVPEPVTTLDAARKQVSHRFPEFLPDGKHFTYAVQPALQPSLLQVEIASLEDPVGRPLLVARNAPRYAPPGYLLFPRDQALVAQRIDVATGAMTGDLIPLADNVDVVDRVIGSLATSTADDGTIVYDEPDHRATDGFWYSRDGRPIGMAFRHGGRVFSADIAPRGDVAILTAIDPSGATATLVRLADGSESRVIREERVPRYVAWSPADNRFVANVFEQGHGAIVSMDPSGGAERRILDLEEHWLVTSSVGPDRSIVFDDPFRGQLTDIVYLPRGEGTQTRSYLATGADERGGKVSPDGRFMAYASDVSGRFEIYVDAFPERREAVRVSVNGATAASARWRGDGRELYFTSSDGRTLLACDVASTPSPAAGKPRALFTLPPEAIAFLPSTDGSKFLVFVPVGEPRTSLTLVQNWSAQLEAGK